MFSEQFSALSRDKKIEHCIDVLDQRMKSAQENNQEPTNVFDQQLVDEGRAADAAFDEYFPQVLTQIATTWLESPKSFLNIVNVQMHTDYDISFPEEKAEVTAVVKKKSWKFWKK